MNYEAKSKKINQPLKTSIWWATVGGNAWAETGIISSLFVISVLVLSLQWTFRSEMRDYAREYHTKVESEWKIINKLAENHKKSSTYYLYIKNSKYNWVREVDAQTYLTHDIGSTIKIEYDKSDLLGESGVSWHVNLVMLLTILSMLVFMAATLFVVSSLLLIDRVNSNDFWHKVWISNDRRDFSDEESNKIKKTYNKYVKILKAVNVFIIVYFIGFTAFMIKQFTFYMGW
jgi:hypothetical protein